MCIKLYNPTIPTSVFFGICVILLFCIYSTDDAIHLKVGKENEIVKIGLLTSFKEKKIILNDKLDSILF